MAKPLRLAPVGSVGSSGDRRYSLYKPAAALARQAYQRAVANGPLCSRPPTP